MSTMVVLFFAFTTLAVLVSGYLLPRYVPTASGKRFGYALYFVGIAFAIWSVAVITKPEKQTLTVWVTSGLVVLLGGLLFLTAAATAHLAANWQRIALGVTAVIAIFLLVMRFFYPSEPYFSPQGLFYFNQQPPVAFITIVLLAGTIVPAVLAVYRDIAQRDSMPANLFLTACMAELVGGVLLLSSKDDDLLFMVGWGMGAGFLLLLLVSAGLWSRLAPSSGQVTASR